MNATYPKMPATHRLCPACGELLVSSRCPECAPTEPARPYSERITQQINVNQGAVGMAVASAVDVRRANGEWVTSPDDRDPQTRRAHPTLVRTALAEAEERARDKMSRSALVTHVQTTTRPRFGQTSPRLRQVTPLPPPLSERGDDDATDLPSNTLAEQPNEPAPLAAVIVAAMPSPSEPTANATQPVDPSTFTARGPRSPEHLLPTPQPEPYFEIPEPETDRRAIAFWLVLLGTAAVVLGIAAL